MEIVGEDEMRDRGSLGLRMCSEVRQGRGDPERALGGKESEDQWNFI